MVKGQVENIEEKKQQQDVHGKGNSTFLGKGSMHL